MDMETRSILAEHEFDRPQPLPVPSWSPDGSRILFVESTGTAYQLKVWDIGTGEIVVYEPLFVLAYGGPANAERFLDALVAFETSLISNESRFARYYFGSDSTAITAQERRGWELFQSPRSGCMGCHVAIPEPESEILRFTDTRFHNLGVGYENGIMEDLGRYGFIRRRHEWGSFRTPSLHNVALTAPYMHDGSLATLEEVVAFYADGGIPNPNLDKVMIPRELSPEERADLVAFLKALTSEWIAHQDSLENRMSFLATPN